MAVNPVGAVPIFDGGTPRVMTARNPIGVTGGQLVFFAGAADSVSSGADTFAALDVVISGLASGTSFNGMVTTAGNTASGTNSYVAVATAGTFLIAAGSDVFGGKAVEVMDSDAIRTLGSHIIAASYDDGGASGGRKMGRAITTATSGTLNFAVCTLTP